MYYKSLIFNLTESLQESSWYWIVINFWLNFTQIFKFMFSASLNFAQILKFCVYLMLFLTSRRFNPSMSEWERKTRQNTVKKEKKLKIISSQAPKCAICATFPWYGAQDGKHRHNKCNIAGAQALHACHCVCVGALHARHRRCASACFVPRGPVVASRPPQYVSKRKMRYGVTLRWQPHKKNFKNEKKNKDLINIWQ